MPREEEKLALGKGAAFAKTRLKRLPQQDVTWEADFPALPKPMTQTWTEYLGMVVGQDGSILADLTVRGRPTVNDMATLLANAMRRPLTEEIAHRPHSIHVRGHPQWRELFPHLAELGVGVTVQRELPGIQAAFGAYLRQARERHRAGMAKPSPEEQGVGKLFPSVARWVAGYGHVEVGDQEGFGFVVRAIDFGGVVFEDDKPDTLAEALVSLERGLADHFRRERIEPEG